MRSIVALSSAIVPVSGVTLLTHDQGMESKTRPIMKIVRLLQDMKVELNNELVEDKQVHETLACWCDTNDKEKTKAIEVGTARIAELESSLGEIAAKIKELKIKRKSTQEEMYADQKALDEAEEIRMKESKAFQETETDLIQAIDACKQAVVVLGAHHPTFAQMKEVAHMLQVARVPQIVGKLNSLSAVKSGALKNFLLSVEKTSESSFLAIPGFTSYAPQSGQIFGILKQMKKDFDTDLGQEQASEAKAVAEFKALKAAKLSEIQTAEKAITQFDADVASLGERNAEEVKELENRELNLARDQAFLADLKQKCAATDAEFDQRTKARMEEIAAVDDAIKILNSDESFANFDATVNSFVQIGSEKSQARSRAVAVLQKLVSQSNSPKVAMLAISAQLDAFTKVKAAIDKMVAELKTQQKDEVDHRDECIASLNTNTQDTRAADDLKESLETKIAALQQDIKTLTEKIAESTDAIAETNVQMKRRSEAREGENADYQQTIQDQRLTQMILQKAIDRLAQVYAMLQDAPGAVHTQTSGTHTDAGNGPARFKEYAQNAGGKRVVGLLNKVLQDSQAMESEAIKGEENAQFAYEDFMKQSNTMIIQTTQGITDMTESRARDKSDLSMAQTDFKQTMAQLEGLNDEAGALHKSCDYLLKNFELRQSARSDEIDALNQAKSILSGLNE